MAENEHEPRSEYHIELNQQDLPWLTGIAFDATDEPETPDEAYKLGMEHHDKGNIQAAEQLLSLASREYENAHGLLNDKTLDALEYLGITHRKLGKLKDAEATHQRVVEARKAMSGADHPTTLVAWNRLAMVYRAQNRLDDAEAIYRRVWEAFNKILGPDDEATLRASVSLGNLAYTRKKWPETGEIYASTLSRYETVLGLDHSSTQQVASNLAAVFIQQNKNAEAELILGALVKQIQKALGSNSVRLLPPLLNLSCALDGQEKYEEAQKTLDLLLKSYEVVYGKDHPKTLGIMRRKASTLAKQERLSEAIDVIQKGLSLPPKTHEASNEAEMELMTSLARIYTHQGKFREAQQIHKQLTEKCVQNFGSNHEKTIQSLINEAEMLFIQKEYAEAELAFKDTTTRFEQAFGAQDERTLWSLMGKCHAACLAKRISTVESSIWLLFQKCDEIPSLQNGRAMLVFQELSKDCLRRKKFQQAEDLMNKGYEICLKLFNRGHPVTIFYGLAVDKVRRKSRQNQQGLPIDMSIPPKRSDNTTDSMIDVFEFVVALNTKPSDPSAPLPSGLLANLAMSYEEKWRESGDILYLDTGIDKYETAILVGKDDEPDRSKWFSRVGTLYKARFRIKKSLDDLRKAVELKQMAVDLQAKVNKVDAGELSDLSDYLVDLYEHESTKESLDRAIQLGQQSISLVAPDDQDRVRYLTRQGMALMVRFETNGTSGDLDRAFDLIKEALSLTPKMEPRWKRLCASYADLLRDRFEHNGSMEDLEASVGYVKDALHEAPEDPSLLESLARQLNRRYNALGRKCDLDEAIIAAEKAVELWDKESNYLADGLMRLGYLLIDRFEATGHQEDLDRSIMHLEKARNTPKTNLLAEARCLSGLASAFRLSWMRSRNQESLEAAIRNERLALKVLPEGNVGNVDVMNNLVNNLVDRFKLTKDTKDIEEAIGLCEKVLCLRPTTHVHYPGNLNNLANAVEAKFKEYGEIGDLNLAIEKSEKALSIMDADHPERAGLSYNLGSRYHSRYQINGNSKDIQYAAEQFLDGWRTVNGRPFDRVLAGSQAVYKLIDMGRLEEATNIAMEVVDLLPHVTTRSHSMTDQQYVVREFSGIAGNACSLLLSMGRLNEALEYLEKGRTVMLDLLMSNRLDLTELETVSPQHARQFRQLQDQINKTFSASSVGSSGTQAILQKRLASVSQFDECVKAIRELPGQSRFLLGPQAEEIKAVAKEGLIVIVNITTTRTDAIIIADQKVDSVELPGLSRAQALEWLEKDLTRKPKSRVERRKKHEEYTLLLHWLWVSGVKPIFDHAKLKAQSSSKKLPRVCWIGTGVASMLPFHAAGDKSIDKENTFSYAISSYSSSIKTILQARRKAHKVESSDIANPRLLMIGMPTTKGHASLSGVEEEIKDIKTAVKSSLSVQSLLQPPPERVLSELANYDMVHFACHALPDSKNPLHGHLLLESDRLDSGEADKSGELTVEEIMKMDLKRARIAYLSACSTAENKSTRLLDEAIHLVSAFQVAGFAHVLGTMWPAPDGVSRDIAAGFYQNLASLLSATRGIDEGRAVAEAFHLAVKEARSENDEEPLFWAQFVHFGG